MKRLILVFVFILLYSFGFPTPMMKHPTPSAFDPSVMVIDEKNYIGKVVKDFRFVFEDGSIHSIKEFTKNKPTVILPLFYKCMTGCPLILHSTVRNIQNISRDFNLLVLSFDKDDTISNLVEFRDSHLGDLKDNRVKFGILTQDSISSFTNSTGFKFFFSRRDNTFVHTLVLIFLSPDGKVVRYLFGSSPKEKNISIALAEASVGKFSINSLIDLAFLVCYTYDSKTRSYEINPTLVFGGIGILLVLITLMSSLLIVRRKK